MQTIIIMRFLHPESYGIWLSLMIFLSYGAFSSLGIEYGISNRLPFYHGANDEKRTAEIMDTAYLAWTTLSFIFGIFMFFFALLMENGSTQYRMGLAIVGFLTLSEQQSTFFGRIQTSLLKDFKTGSLILIIRGILSFTILIPLAYFFNLTGFMMGALMVSFITMIIWRTKSNYCFKKKISISALIEIIKLGFPILLVVMGGILMTSLDRILILKLLGVAVLGYYGIISLGGSALYGLLAQAGASMGPHIAEDMGKNNNYVPSLEKYLVKPTILFAYLIVILISFLIIGLPPFIELFLNKYLPGLPAFYIYVPSYFFLSIILTANNILNVILIAKRKQRVVIYIQIIAILIQIFCGYIFVSIDWGISGVAFSSFLAIAFYGLTILSLAAKYVFLQNRKALLFMIDVITPFVYTTILMLIIQWMGNYWFPGRIIIRAFVMLFMVIIAYIPLFILLNKRIKIMSEISSLYNSFLTRIGSIRKTNNSSLQRD